MRELGEKFLKWAVEESGRETGGWRRGHGEWAGRGWGGDQAQVGGVGALGRKGLGQLVFPLT